MKLLVVCSKNSGKIAPFILEQGESLLRLGVEVDYYPIVGKGLVGYWKNRKLLLQKIKSFQPDIIHAHYGLSGLLTNTQRNIPVVTTYHGSDINISGVFILSRLNMVLSAHAIFVSNENRQKSGLSKNSTLLPCGVDTKTFVPGLKEESRKFLGLDVDQKLVLFSSAFDIAVKNSALALSAIALLPEVRLIELKNYSRSQVALLMNAADVALMTSFTEGSPQFIKEAMACNCPVVSVPVGDVPFVLEGVKGCFIADYDAVAIAEKLNMAFKFGRRTEGRKRILELGWSNEKVAEKLLNLYSEILGTKPS
jgi:teichuronic acid biosynthesis glycosyltransferase TuaC